MEVRADHHELRSERADEDLGHEILGRLGCPCLVETDHDRTVDRALGEQFELLLEVRQLQRSRVGSYDGCRMAVESDDLGHQAGRERALLQVPQEHLVAEVYPVVCADSDPAPSWGWGAALGSCDHLHRLEATTRERTRRRCDPGRRTRIPRAAGPTCRRLRTGRIPHRSRQARSR